MGKITFFRNGPHHISLPICWLIMQSCSPLINSSCSLIPQPLTRGGLMTTLMDRSQWKESHVTSEAKSGQATWLPHLLFLRCSFWRRQAAMQEVQLRGTTTGKGSLECSGQQPQLSPRGAGHVSGTTLTSFRWLQPQPTSDSSTWQTPSKNQPAESFPNSWPRNHDQNKIEFKSLNVGIICYTVLGNWNN